jgi:hypothetical protein
MDTLYSKEVKLSPSSEAMRLTNTLCYRSPENMENKRAATCATLL